MIVTTDTKLWMNRVQRKEGYCLGGLLGRKYIDFTINNPRQKFPAFDEPGYFMSFTSHFGPATFLLRVLLNQYHTAGQWNVLHPGLFESTYLASVISKQFFVRSQD